MHQSCSRNGLGEFKAGKLLIDSRARTSANFERGVSSAFHMHPYRCECIEFSLRSANELIHEFALENRRECESMGGDMKWLRRSLLCLMFRHFKSPIKSWNVAEM